MSLSVSQPEVKYGGILHDYQREDLQCRARFKHKRWARQTGKSFTDTLEPALDAALGEKWVILSSGQRMSKENLTKCRMHALAINAGADYFEGEWEEADAVFKTHELNFPGGGSIIGLPANEATARGHSRHVSLDEFTTHKNQRAIWTALFFSITRGYKLRVSGTPKGRGDKFFEIEREWSAKEAAGNAAYHCSHLTLYDAVEKGLRLVDHEGNPITPDDLKEAFGDDEMWEQEAMAEYVDEAEAFLSWDLINAIEDPELEFTPAWAQALVEAAREAHAKYILSRAREDFDVRLPVLPVGLVGDLFLGFDVGRRRDLTVLWLLERIGERLRTACVIRLRKTAFWIQKKVAAALMEQLMVRRACVDETGIGMQLAEDLEALCPGRVEAISFTAGNKEVLATGLKNKAEDRMLAIPAEKDSRYAFHAIKRHQTGTGHFRFDAEASEKGHADEFWSCALACQAASRPLGSGGFATTDHDVRPE